MFQDKPKTKLKYDKWCEHPYLTRIDGKIYYCKKCRTFHKLTSTSIGKPTRWSDEL